jgi:hypothetical protein
MWLRGAGRTKVTVFMATKLMCEPYLLRKLALRLCPFDYKDALLAYGRFIFDLFKPFLLDLLLHESESLLLYVKLVVHAFARLLCLLGSKILLTLILKHPAFFQKFIADGFSLVGIRSAIL